MVGHAVAQQSTPPVTSSLMTLLSDESQHTPNHVLTDISRLQDANAGPEDPLGPQPNAQRAHASLQSHTHTHTQER
jgi:hypothetical protein